MIKGFGFLEYATASVIGRGTGCRDSEEAQAFGIWALFGLIRLNWQ